MKTRRILISAAFLLACTLTFARSLSSDEAMVYAEKFFHITHTKGTSPLKLAWDGRLAGAMTKGTAVYDNSQPEFYAFNLSGGGFVIISAETAYHPLIAYSLSESFDPAAVPDNYRWLLECVRNDIRKVRTSGVEADKSIVEQWAGIDAMAAASTVTLNTAEWNQTNPYYNDCPKIGNSYCLTGCVATAFAILMHYNGVHHNAPTSPNEIVVPGYTTNKLTVPNRDLAGHVYRFSEMPMTTSLLNSGPQEIRDNVAMLMRDVGQAFSMDYGTSSSGATTQKSVAVMSKFFKYAKNNRMELKDGYSIDEWMAMVRNSIDNDNPIVISASSGNSGHCFILDGYDSNGLVRYNLGWGGVYHTVFTVIANSTNPEQYNKYADNYTALFNYRPDPDGETEALPYRMSFYSSNGTSAGLSISSYPVIKNKNFNLDIINLSNCDPWPRENFILGVMKVDGATGQRKQIGDFKKYFFGGDGVLSPGSYVPLLTFYYLKIDDEIKFGDFIQLEYNTNPSSGSDDVQWAVLDTPSDGSAVTSCPLVPAFVIDLPNECNCGEQYQLKLVNGAFPWAYNTTWSCKSLTGGSATISSHPSDTHIRRITFNSPGEYLVTAEINGDSSGRESVIAKIVAK